MENNLVFFAIILGVSAISCIASDMFIAALPDMMRYFEVSSGTIQWSMSVFFAGVAVSQLVYGPLSDYAGRKRVLILGFVFFIIGCLLCMSSQSFSIFLIGRLCQGCGAGATTCISRAIIRDIYKGKTLVKVLSQVGMGLAIIPAVAPLLGSYIYCLAGWKIEFLFMFLYSIGLFFLVIVRINETNPYIFENKKSVITMLMDYKHVITDSVFLVNVSISSLIIGFLYVFYATSSFYLKNTFYWSEIQYGQIPITVAGSLFVGRKLNLILIKYFLGKSIILIGSFLSIFAAIAMFFLDFFEADIIIAWLLPISIYAISGGILFSNTFVEATEKHFKINGTASSLYGVVQMLIVFLIISFSSIFGILNIKQFCSFLFWSSVVSIFLCMFLINKKERLK